MATSKEESAGLIDLLALSATDRPEVAATGWDPYEVWRTRVLLPRLAKQMKRAEIALATDPSMPDHTCDHRGPPAKVVDECGDEPITGHLSGVFGVRRAAGIF